MLYDDICVLHCLSDAVEALACQALPGVENWLQGITESGVAQLALRHDQVRRPGFLLHLSNAMQLLCCIDATSRRLHFWFQSIISDRLE